jgi:polar amino acid transport system substrate-binding protein
VIIRLLSTGIAVTSLACYGALAAEIKVPDEVKSSGSLEVAMTLGYVPFNYTDSAGKPGGLDVELANEVALLIGAKLDISAIPFASQIPALVSGRIKIAWSTFSVTKERLGQVDFVEYLQAGSVATVLPQNKVLISAEN